MSAHPRKKFRRGKKRRMTKFTINELSAVDFPAQEGATALIMKRQPVSDVEVTTGTIANEPHPTVTISNPQDVEKNAEDGVVVITSADAGHTHGVSIHPGTTGGSVWWSQNPEDEGGGSHDHPWILEGDGNLTIGMNAGHTHTVDRSALLQAFMRLRPVLLQEDTVIALARKCGLRIEANGGIIDITKQEEVSMTPEETARLERAENLAELNDAQRVHFNGLNEDGQTTFLGKSADERQSVVDAELAKQADPAPDPVAYTCDDGTAIRKSAGDLVLKLAKDADESRRELAKERSVNKQRDFEKRADESIGNYPGSLKVRAALVKAIDGIEDEDTREAAGLAVIAGNSALKGAFTIAGHGSAETFDPAVSKASDKLDALAKARVADKGGTYVDAYWDVSDENPELAEAAITGAN